MPIDPNSPTSDVGTMYRDYLQSKGMPLTNENMQRVISQSQREPGMIAGLSVQQPGGMHADAPPNLAGASASNSGGALPIPQASPTGMQQMPGPTPAQGAAAASQGGMPAPSVMSQGSPNEPTVGMPSQPYTQEPPQTPPPGQPPAASQSMLPAGIANMSVGDALGALGIGGGALASGLALRGAGQLKGAQPPQQSPMPPPVAASKPVGVMNPTPSNLFPVGSAQAQRSSSSPMQGPPTAPLSTSNTQRPMQGPPPPPPQMQGPPPPMQGPPEAPTATSPIGNILKQDPVPNNLPFVHGVNPVGKEIQGPPMGPPAMQGPPVGLVADPATAPIGNPLVKGPTAPVHADSANWTGRAPVRGMRGVRIP